MFSPPHLDIWRDVMGKFEDSGFRSFWDNLKSYIEDRYEKRDERTWGQKQLKDFTERETRKMELRKLPTFQNSLNEAGFRMLGIMLIAAWGSFILEILGYYSGNLGEFIFGNLIYYICYWMEWILGNRRGYV